MERENKLHIIAIILWIIVGILNSIDFDTKSITIWLAIIIIINHHICFMKIKKEIDG